jgi:hypothetical protein
MSEAKRGGRWAVDVTWRGAAHTVLLRDGTGGPLTDGVCLWAPRNDFEHDFMNRKTWIADMPWRTSKGSIEACGATAQEALDNLAALAGFSENP